jgi:hypothetical protein
MPQSVIYEGKRTDAGCVVTVDGELLPPRTDLRNHSPTGFEWGYGGSGPAQLALAILADHFQRLGNDSGVADRLALRYYQTFKFRVIGNLRQEAGWKLTTADIEASALVEVPWPQPRLESDT